MLWENFILVAFSDSLSTWPKPTRCARRRSASTQNLNRERGPSGCCDEIFSQFSVCEYRSPASDCELAAGSNGREATLDCCSRADEDREASAANGRVVELKSASSKDSWRREVATVVERPEGNRPKACNCAFQRRRVLSSRWGVVAGRPDRLSGCGQLGLDFVGCTDGQARNMLIAAVRMCVRQDGRFSYYSPRHWLDVSIVFTCKSRAPFFLTMTWGTVDCLIERSHLMSQRCAQPISRTPNQAGWTK